MAFHIDNDARCAVIGDGSWATALVKIIQENEPEVGWYVRLEEIKAHILKHRTNPRYLRDVHFETDTLRISSSLDEVVSAADVIVLAVPSVYLKVTLDKLTVPLEDKFVVSAIKGIVPEENITVTEYLNRHYHVPFDRMGTISGPCHAEEVALERLSYLTVSCKHLEDVEAFGRKLRTDYINITPSTDIYGAEYASVLKNVYALGVGMAVSLGYGDNFLAVLISNAAMEMARFMQETYPAERNMFASAYLGDLLVTSYSQFSRNRRFGLMIGKGYDVDAARMEMDMVAEGYYVAKCIHEINKRFKVDMPIAEGIYDILYHRAQPGETIEELTKILK